MSEDKKVIRFCKLCGKAMDEPLQEGDKLFMFCSTECHETWDRERAYHRQIAKDMERTDGN